MISYFHVVLGEVVPKNLAIAKADRLAALIAPALLIFYRVTLPFVVVIERSSDVITRLLHLKGSGHGGGHTAEELKLIVSTSRGLGYLPEAQEDMIHRVLDLGAISVREIMVPRNDIVSISSDATLDEVLRTMIEQQHSRLPVYEGTPEKIVGLLHYKDLLPVWEERRSAIRSSRPSRAFRIVRLLRPHGRARDQAVSQMLDEFRRRVPHGDGGGRVRHHRRHADRGRRAGTDRRPDRRRARRKGSAPRPEADEVELDGATRIRDLESEYGIEIPADAGFETLAGFLLFRLRRDPAARRQRGVRRPPLHRAGDGTQPHRPRAHRETRPKPA